MANNVLTDTLSEPLNGATTATVDIDTGIGNLTIDPLPGGEPLLASGTLQYFEKQGHPTCTLQESNGQATLTLKEESTVRSWFRLPWDACLGGYEWQIHLNPTVKSAITAHTGGGNVKLDLAGMAVTRLMADTGGGNMDVMLPDNVANLDVAAHTGGGNITVEVGSGTTGHTIVNASSGAGNVAVQVPDGMAARVYAHSGLGKVIVDPRFNPTGKDTYQSPGYDTAADKMELTLKSGAGNVTVDTK